MIRFCKLVKGLWTQAATPLNDEGHNYITWPSSFNKISGEPIWTLTEISDTKQYTLYPDFYQYGERGKTDKWWIKARCVKTVE